MFSLFFRLWPSSQSPPKSFTKSVFFLRRTQDKESATKSVAKSVSLGRKIHRKICHNHQKIRRNSAQLSRSPSFSRNTKGKRLYKKLRHDMGGANLPGGVYNAPDNAPSRKKTSSKRASGVLSLGFLYRKQSPIFGRCVLREVFLPPLFFRPRGAL